MTTFTVAGIDLGDAAPAKWSADGRRARVSGMLSASTAPLLAVKVNQFQGILDNPDEDAVPVAPSADTSLTRFFRVRGGGLDLTPESYTSLRVPFDLDLDLVGYSPVIESRLLGRLRTNSHSIALGTTVPWVAFPTDANFDYVGGTTRQTRTGDGGSVVVGYTTDGTLLVDRTISWQCDPGDWYDMAARVEVTGDGGSTWDRLPGRRMGAAVAASTGWRLNNGYVRVSYGGGAGLLSVQHHDGSQWETAKVYKLTRGNDANRATIGEFRTISLMRSGPENVIVRLGLEHDSSAKPAPVNIDINLRRGSRYVAVTMTRKAGALSLAELAAVDANFGIYRNTAEASTSHTSGLHATSADADGNKFILTSADAKTNDLTQGGFYSATDATTFRVMISSEIGGASGSDTFTNLVYSYFANVNEDVRFARR